MRNGQVEIGGRLQFRGMSQAIERMCATIDGVVSVSAHFTYGTDDIPERQSRSGMPTSPEQRGLSGL